MSAVNINKANFLSEVIHSDKPVLMDFWAPWSAAISRCAKSTWTSSRNWRASSA